MGKLIESIRETIFKNFPQVGKATPKSPLRVNVQLDEEHMIKLHKEIMNMINESAFINTTGLEIETDKVQFKTLSIQPNIFLNVTHVKHSQNVVNVDNKYICIDSQ